MAMTKNTTQQLQVEAAQKRKTNKVKISRQRETKDKLQYTDDDGVQYPFPLRHNAGMCPNGCQ